MYCYQVRVRAGNEASKHMHLMSIKLLTEEEATRMAYSKIHVSFRYKTKIEDIEMVDKPDEPFSTKKEVINLESLKAE